MNVTTWRILPTAAEMSFGYGQIMCNTTISLNKTNSLGSFSCIYGVLGIVILYIITLSLPQASAALYDVEVNSSDVRGSLDHFWRSTGFCPPLPHQSAYDFDFGKDMILNLAMIGSTPHSGIEQVRIHWLLDLVTVDKLTNGRAEFDFSKLDDLIELLWMNGMKPGFEIMGNPSGIFNDFENETQVHMWKDLVQQLAENYVSQYGLSYVSTWNFETWNEPDCRDFDKLKMTVQGFLNYYDASWEGLKSVSKLLSLGGPGDGCDRVGHSKYSDAFLEHITNGTNFFSGNAKPEVDFLSYHRKGSGASMKIIQQEGETFNKISEKYPSLARIPFYNDEADPLVGWSKDEWWRADATYAAIVAKIISQHQNIIIANTNSKINYTLLSNDNGFLSFYPRQFSQRTLMARFQVNNTKPPFVQFVRKPVHAVMSLLSLLGDQQLFVNISEVVKNNVVKVSNGSEFGALATYHIPDVPESADSRQVAILVYNSADTTYSNKNDSVRFTVNLDAEFVKFDITIVQYMINNYISNPFAVWEKYGKPDFPTTEMFREMRKQEGPIVSKRRLLKRENPIGGKVSTEVAVPQPGVILTHICAKSTFPADQVTGLKIHNMTIGQILITWSDNCVNSKCIYRYDVEYSPKSDKGPYQVVNSDIDSIVTSFVYVPENMTSRAPSDDDVRGFYRVRAVDYFDRFGEYSLPEKYPK